MKKAAVKTENKIFKILLVRYSTGSPDPTKVSGVQQPFAIYSGDCYTKFTSSCNLNKHSLAITPWRASSASLDEPSQHRSLLNIIGIRPIRMSLFTRICFPRVYSMSTCAPVTLFQPKYQLGHPKYYEFLLYKKIQMG